MSQSENTALRKLDQNGLQVMELIVSGNSFGIDIACIRELIWYHGVQQLAHRHPSVEGILHLRGQEITVVDLATYFAFPASNNPERDLLIITQTNQMNLAFHVHQVKNIIRISKDKDIIRISRDSVEEPSTAVYGGKHGIVIRIARLGDRVIPIIDFNRIANEISASASTKAYPRESEE